MITVSIQELIAICATVATMAMTAGAWFGIFKRMRARLRAHDRMIAENILPRLAQLDGGRPTTRELPAYVPEAEDSNG